jgi:hypothetical protein
MRLLTFFNRQAAALVCSRPSDGLRRDMIRVAPRSLREVTPEVTCHVERQEAPT